MNSRAKNASTSSPHVALSSRRASQCVSLEEDEHEVAGIEVDRVSFMNTALRALPGQTLRTFFAPVLTVKSVFFRRRRLTQMHMSSNAAKMEKTFKEAIRVLTKALVDASLELFDNPLVLDEKDLATALAGKMTPLCYEPGAVLVYPGEYPETMFVHVVLSGSVHVVNYQPQSRKAVVGDSSKRQYFVSNDTIRLNGSLSFQPELFKYITNSTEAASDSTSDVASTSNVSTAIQRSLRRASRLAGQPTLLPTRTELCRAPYVCCATEALGLEPFRLATITAEATAPSAKGEGGSNTRITETMRIRVKDLHDALIELAISKNKKSKISSSAAGGATRHSPTLVDYISAARVRSVSRHYPLNEILMRQSWLLQDTPPHTIRALITQLTPRSFLPGEVILCPHTQSRQLCFLRRGIITIEEPSTMDIFNEGCCQCGNSSEKGNVLQEVPVGASFGELSVLFGERRHFILRAHTTCDIWCLSHHSFAATVRRDDALRESLLSKAAALRMRWLGEQRFTPSLAQILRECCGLFRDAADSFIYLIQERIEPVVYPPGTLLTSTSTRCTEMFIILYGKVTSIVDGVAEYGPGSVIGESTIISHRWPLGLVSKSMVEGWKLDRKKLLDALHRVEILRRHSGEVGAHAPQLMQRVFAPPVPPCDVDAVGRSRMPLVGPPPRGGTYLEFAQWLAELQLKALCFRYRDYVKWSDISYTTLPGEHGVRLVKESVSSIGETNFTDGTEASDIMAGSAVNAARQGKKNKNVQKQEKRKVVAGSVFPFYVNAAMTHQPFTRAHLRRPPAAVVDDADKYLLRQRALTTGWKTQPHISLLPQLKQLTTILETRDKMLKAEVKQNAPNDAQQERREHIGMSNGVSVTSGSPPVHIFLEGPNPRVQITVAEAITIGYVLQFPDTKRIQSCVSNIDPDVTIGLPQHRERRRQMVLTPNDRHYRHCFLFAASRLGEKTAEEVLVSEAATREAESKGRAQQLATLLIDDASTRRRQSIGFGAMITEGGLNVSGDWNKSSFTKSPSRDGASPGYQSTPTKHRGSRMGVLAGENTFLQQLAENPDRAMDSLRAKFAVPQERSLSPGFGASEEGTDHSFCRSSSEGVAIQSGQGEGVMERLRRVTMNSDTPGGEGASTGPPPRGPGTYYVEDRGTGKTIGEGESVMEKFMKGEDAPLFIDGYGQLGMEGKTSFIEGQESLTEAGVVMPNEAFRQSSSLLLERGERHQASQWVPHNFVMPTVSEAVATMRRIQRDVNGLNAVAEEQRREKQQKRRQGVEHAPESFEGPVPQELQRLVEDWTLTYRADARDPFRPATIPPQLLPEAGTDYLAEEFHHTRRYQQQLHRQQQQEQQQQQRQQGLEAAAISHGMEMWRGEAELKDKRDGNFRGATHSRASRNLFTYVGSKKFGLPSRPLRNPNSHMNESEYQLWAAERDAIFAAASRQK